MVQHFLLSARSRGLGIATILSMTETQAHCEFCRIRWSETGGQPMCPRCACTACWTCGKDGFRFRCKRCLGDFTATSRTLLAKHKLSHRMLLAAIHTFLCGVAGTAALEMSRILDVSYKTAFVLSHKLRVAMGSEGQTRCLGGPGWEVEVDGRYSGGYLKPANWRENRRDRRLARNQNGKRRVTVVIRARNGQCRTWAFRTEEGAVDFIIERLLPGTVVYADDAPSWNRLHEHFDVRRVNHQECYSAPDACTNHAESYFARMARAEHGQYLHFSGPYLWLYGWEAAWREDHRRDSVTKQFALLGALIGASVPDPRFCGYWQRHCQPVGPRPE